MTKSVPDLLESIMKTTGLVRGELRMILMKIDQLRHKITGIRLSTFWMSGKNTDFRRRLLAGAK